MVGFNCFLKPIEVVFIDLAIGFSGDLKIDFDIKARYLTKFANIFDLRYKDAMKLNKFGDAIVRRLSIKATKTESKSINVVFRADFKLRVKKGFARLIFLRFFANFSVLTGIVLIT